MTQEVAIVNDFKYLGAYVGSTNKDVKVRIGLAWVAFHKLKSILKAPKTKINFKIRLFKAACISILLYACETWILTKHLANRLDAYATNCYRIMLGIDQKNDHITNEHLYEMVQQVPISTTICDRQLKFTGHCIRIAEGFVLYESQIKPTNRREAPRTSYREQISRHITDKSMITLSEKEICELAKLVFLPRLGKRNRKEGNFSSTSSPARLMMMMMWCP